MDLVLFADRDEKAEALRVGPARHGCLLVGRVV